MKTMMVLMMVIQLTLALGRHIVVDDVTVAGYRLRRHVIIVDHAV